MFLLKRSCLCWTLAATDSLALSSSARIATGWGVGDRWGGEDTEL